MARTQHHTRKCAYQNGEVNQPRRPPKSEYKADAYHYSPSVEPRIVDAQGGIYGPYTATWFDSIRDTDIEHIVARSDAHDSGLCVVDADTKDEFASDLLNLNLASPTVNRHRNSNKDTAEWLPDLNQCWYVNRIVQTRLEYGLTIDQGEADATDTVLDGCTPTDIVVPAPTATATATPTPAADALATYDGHENGRINCADAQAHGIAPFRRGHPAYAPEAGLLTATAPEVPPALQQAYQDAEEAPTAHSG